MWKCVTKTRDVLKLTGSIKASEQCALSFGKNILIRKLCGFLIYDPSVRRKLTPDDFFHAKNIATCKLLQHDIVPIYIQYCV